MHAEDPTPALLVGAHAPFGAEIAERLRRAGYALQASGTVDEAFPEQGGAPDASIGVLVVNAPLARTGLRFADVDDSAFEAALQTQLYEIAEAVQRALPRLARGARIVFVGARGHHGAWGGVHLMAAGAALVALTRSLALELAAEEIRVNLLATDFLEPRGTTAERRAAVAHTVEFLCAAELGLTGETLMMDGQTGLRMSESRDLRAPRRQPVPAASTPRSDSHSSTNP